MIKTYFDQSAMGSVTTTPQGYLKFDAIATRSGIFLYPQPDGSVRRAYRSPEEVFKKESMDSFALMPIINDHEMGRTPKITADNITQYQIGTIGETIRRDKNFMRVTGIIQNKVGIQAVKDGRRGLSLAYDSDDIEDPGTTPDGLQYDYRQTNIRGNHLAIVNRGRAGDAARIPYMDTADIDPEATISQGERFMKYNLDGVEIDAPESIVNALVKARTDLATVTVNLDAANKAVTTTKTSLDAMTAIADASKAELTKLKAVDTEKLVQDGIAARIALVEQASIVCDAGQLKGKTDAEIKGIVIKAVFPDLKMDGKSDEYVSAMFDAALTAGDTKQRKDALAKQRKAATSMDNGDETTEKPESTMLQDAYKKPCSLSAKK